jgi:hypothetical protein
MQNKRLPGGHPREEIQYTYFFIAIGNYIHLYHQEDHLLEYSYRVKH